MRSRLLKPGFFTNEDLAELPPMARLLFAGLWCLADREGRLEDRPKRIKAELFAYDKVNVSTLLDQLVTKGFVLRYEVNGTQCLSIPTFPCHQKPHPREAPSTLPPYLGQAGGSPEAHPGPAEGEPKAGGLGSPRFRVSSVSKTVPIPISITPPIAPPFDKGGADNPSSNSFRHISLADQDPEALKFWGQVLERLKVIVTKPNWETWLKDTVGIAFEGDKMVIGAPTEMAVEWLSAKLRPLCAKEASQLRGRPMEIEFAPAGIR